MGTPHFHASGSNCGIGSLLESGKYSDLVINCKGRSFKVHRAILCPQSEVITKECDINMREKNTGVIHHEEYDPDTMERMLSFVYTGKYVVKEFPDPLSTGDAPAKDEPEEDAATPEPEAPNDESVQDELEEDDAIPELEAPNDEPVQDELEEDDAIPEPEAPNDELPAPRADDDETCSTTESPYGLFATEKWVAHARVYGLADYYDMPHLRFYALERFKNVTENVDNSDDLEDFIDVVEEVCKRTVREHDPLRGLVHEIVLLHAPILACNGSFITALGEREKLQDFAADMFGNLGRHMIAKTAESDARTDTLRTRAKDLEVALDAAEESYNHTEGVMDRLVRSLKALPEYCRSTGCDRVMAPFEFERHGQGDWLLRCGRNGCKCKLNF